MEKYPFGFPITVFESAIAHNTEVNDLLEKVMSLSTRISAGKDQIVETKHFLNEAVVAVKHYKLCKAYDLPAPIDTIVARYGLDLTYTYINEYTKQLNECKKDLKEIYIEHNKTVEELKNALDKFARDCAIRHARQSQLSNVGDIKCHHQINKEEQSLTTLNLSRVGVLTLIKKLSDEIKAKPTCNNFTVTINSGVTKS